MIVTEAVRQRRARKAKINALFENTSCRFALREFDGGAVTRIIKVHLYQDLTFTGTVLVFGEPSDKPIAGHWGATDKNHVSFDGVYHTHGKPGFKHWHAILPMLPENRLSGTAAPGDKKDGRQRYYIDTILKRQQDKQKAVRMRKSKKRASRHY